MPTRSLACGVAAALAFALVSCRGPNHDPRVRIDVPLDFALEIHVDGDAAAADPALQPAHYVLQPNRKLRVISGTRAKYRSFPPLARVIRHQEQRALYAQARDLAPPDPLPAGEPGAATGPGAAAAYEITIISRGGSRTFITTPEDSPAAARLVGSLAELRWGASENIGAGEEAATLEMEEVQ